MSQLLLPSKQKYTSHKIICAYSGIEFSCEHLPLAISTREIAHPLFSVSRKRLLSLAATWAEGKLTHTESYLLYLSLLNSTDLIEWRAPALYCEKSPAIIANNMEQLLHIVAKIDVITSKDFILPHFVISPDTRTLDNSYHWIQLWDKNYRDWADDKKERSNEEILELNRRTNAIEKLVKTPHKRIEDYPKILAQWARQAANFPTFSITINKKKIELADYWEQIVIRCAKSESIFQVPESDLNELIAHCENELIAPVNDDGTYTIGEGSLHATTLMRYLRKGAMMQKNYLNLGDIDLSSKEGTAYRILKPNESAEDANIQNMIDTAPIKEPVKSSYPSLIEYIKAKARWVVSQAYIKQLESTYKAVTDPLNIG